MQFVFFINGCNRSIFVRRSFPWLTCFLVQVGKRLALCTWLCGPSYSTAIKASTKLQHSKLKRNHLYRIQKNSTKDRNLYRIFRVRDVEMISISQDIARYVAMFFFREAVKSCNSTRTCFSAPQLWGCAKVHGCLPLVPWQRCRGKNMSL